MEFGGSILAMGYNISQKELEALVLCNCNILPLPKTGMAPLMHTFQNNLVHG